MASSLEVFNNKYEEFATNLRDVFPELASAVATSLSHSPVKRMELFRDEILPRVPPGRDSSKNPGILLPGVQITDELWAQISEKSQKAVQEHLTVLSFLCLMENFNDASGSSSVPEGWTESFMKKMFEDMKSSMGGMDFSKIGEKLSQIFGEGKMPQFPEKFMNGQIAKLAEEIVKEFKIEDLGLDPAQMEAAGNDPNKALNLVMEIFTKNPARLQQTIGRLTKKLQQKIQSGALRPQELVAEAEELMKTFSENPQFVEMMEVFRQTFGMAEDPDLNRAAGQDGSARLSIVRERLRKKLEKKKGGPGGAAGKR